MYTIDNLMEDYRDNKKVFPLLTRKTLSKRWGVSRQVVSNWSERDEDFPSPVEGLVHKETRTELIYPYYAVEEYEEQKGIVRK